MDTCQTCWHFKRIGDHNGQCDELARQLDGQCARTMRVKEKFSCIGWTLVGPEFKIVVDRTLPANQISVSHPGLKARIVIQEEDPL